MVIIDWSKGRNENIRMTEPLARRRWSVNQSCLYRHKRSTLYIHSGEKTAPFYFCNNFVKPNYISITFGTQILK